MRRTKNEVNQALLQSPLPDLVNRLGQAVADAQFAMDKNAVDIAKMMADKDAFGVQLREGETPRSLLELGFTPTFYQITTATIEAKVAFSMSRSREFSVGASVGVDVKFVSASVDASYSQKYSFEASGSSSIAVHLAAVPPPSVFNDYLKSARSPEPESID